MPLTSLVHCLVLSTYPGVGNDVGTRTRKLALTPCAMGTVPGWHGWSRTSSLPVNSRVLYPLSYMPKIGGHWAWCSTSII